MKYDLDELVIETTRRCNLKCEHCMRGLSQNIEMDKNYIDTFFENNKINSIDRLVFSGGEPTLNPEIIVYTINKIINENINVHSVNMVTNGQIYSSEIVDAFNRFNEYRNKRALLELNIDINKLSDINDKKILNFIKTYIDRHAKITFSTDPFHFPIKEEVRKAYMDNSKGLLITDWDVSKNTIFKTGLSTIGEEYNYELIDFPYSYHDEDRCNVFGSLYLTASGYVTTNGNGSYEDMDKINCGRIEDFSMEDLLQYGHKFVNDNKPKNR